MNVKKTAKVRSKLSESKFVKKLAIILLTIAILVLISLGPASVASTGKAADNAFGDLTKTKLGQHTLKSADATTDLLAKQAKLVSKWGAKKADEVVSKGWFGSGTAERINDLNKIVKAMPDNLIDDFTTDRAVKFLGEKGFADILLKGATQNVIDLNKLDAEKLFQYVKADRKIGINDPLADIGQHQLLKMYKAPAITTKVGDQSIDGVAILKKGDQGKGWEHIKTRGHDSQIQESLKLSDSDAAVKEVIREVIETAKPAEVKHIAGNSYEITKNIVRDGKSHDIFVLVSDRPGNVGSIVTAYPI